MSEKNPWSIIKVSYACLTSGNIISIYVALFFLACGAFGLRTFLDGFQGRNCDKGFNWNDPFSYLSTGGCGLRGAFEPFPRPVGYDKNSRP